MSTEQTPVEERKHHPYSPSSLQNREACPCFENRNTQHVKAIIGTLQHSVTETGEDDHRLSDDEALAAAECLDFYERQKTLMLEDRERAAKAAAQQTGMTTVWPLVIEETESYLPVDDCKFDEFYIANVQVKDGPKGKMEPAVHHRIVESTTAGYVDRALISWDRTHGILLDWKFGAWAVEKASNNLQGIAYALGLFKKYPTLQTIKFFFKQPHLNLLTEATFTRAQVPELYLRVQTVVARAKEARQRMMRDDFSMANPMAPACNFCANLGRCPKVAEMAIRVGSKFAPLQVPSNITPTGLKNDEDTTIGLRLSQVMAVWAKAFRSTITERAIRGTAPIPEGFRMETRADREIVSVDKFIAVTHKYLTEAELAPLAQYTFGSVEEKIKEKAPRGSKKSTLEEYQAALKEAGAVKLGDSYTFLKAVSGKAE